MGDFSIKLRAGKTICSDCSRCFWSERNERRVTAPGELLEGAMEHRFTAGAQRADAPSAQGRRGELGGSRQCLGAGTAVRMHSELLKLPLGVKIHVKPSSKAVFSRGVLGEKLPLSSWFFDLGDPYCRRLGTEYNSLHDPHLQEYHHRKRNFRLLKRGGFITRDGQVVCTLKEFNQYRQYLTTHSLEDEKMKRRAEERLQQQLPKTRNVRKAPGPSNSSCLRERLWKPSCPPTAKGTKDPVRTRRVKVAFDKAKTNSQPEQGQEGARLAGSSTGVADSERKPHMAADSQFTAASEQDTTEAEIWACAWRRYQEKAKEQLPTEHRYRCPSRGSLETQTMPAETWETSGASQVAQDPVSEYTEILELASKYFSKRQPSQCYFPRQNKKQGLSPILEEQSPETSKAAELPVLEQGSNTTTAAVL